MNDSQLVKCPRCRARNTLHTPYLKCYNCRYIDEKDISYRVNEIEKEQREKVREIIKFLFSSKTPSVEFPESSLNPESGYVNWGWIKRKNNIIFLPRKTFYLPNDELTDTVVHEVCHLLSEAYHNDTWYDFYLQQRKKVFAKFSDFANSTNPQTKFTKGYKVYPDPTIITK